MIEINLEIAGLPDKGSVYKRSAARGIAFRDGKLLVIHTDKGDYKFPGGGVEPGESLEQALGREMLEETGLTTSLKHITYLGNHYQDPGSIRQPVHAYLAEYCIQHHRPKPDDGEYIQLYKVSKLMFFNMLRHGYIKDANTFIAGILALFQLGILSE